MINTLRAALVIARRDYVATVWSRTFFLFLIGPLFPVLFGVMFGAIGARMGEQPPPPVIAVIATPDDFAALNASRDRLEMAFNLPRIEAAAPGSVPAALLGRPGTVAVIDHLSAAPRLTGSPGALDTYGKLARLLIEDMHAAPRPTVTIERVAITPRAVVKDDRTRVDLARGSQLLLLMLTMILAGMLLSNLIEEKSNKVIEILAAAVPVDAIFLGKLAAMLGMSLTGIAIWSGAAISGIALFAPHVLAGLATPAVGWPLFVALGIAYFIACYLLLGALFLGIGGQAATVREVQTLSMPVTMAQLMIFAFAAASVDGPNSLVAHASAIFPWSSPFTMISRAAQLPEVWPHLAALVWQFLWIVLIIRMSARQFRRSVLKSGPQRSRGYMKALFRRGMPMRS